MYAVLTLENPASRRLPTKFEFMALINLMVYAMLVSQICGHFIVLPGVKYQTAVRPKAGITRYVDEIPTAPEVITEPEETQDVAPEILTISVEPAVSNVFDDIFSVPETPELIDWEEGMAPPENSFSEETVEAFAILLEGEGKGLESLTELSAIGWTVVDRVYYDGYPDDVFDVITQENQFYGYTENGTYSERSYWMANDVLSRYEKELAGETEVGRTLPLECKYFYGDGKHNYFSETEGGKVYQWDEFESPYVS